jgi:hypothetical protein
MMLQLLKLFTTMILQVTISFVVLHCMPVAWRNETLININISLNVGLTEWKEIGLCNVSDCWIHNTDCHQHVYQH